MKQRKGNAATKGEEEQKAEGLAVEETSKEGKKKTKKDKKEIQGLGSPIVNLQLPIYGLAVQHVGLDQEDKKEEEEESKGSDEASARLVVIVGGGGGPGNTGIENKVALFQFKDGGLHLLALADQGECAIMNLALHPQERVIACGAQNKCRVLQFTKLGFSQRQEFQTDFFEDKEESDQKAVLFTPNGEMLITAGVDGIVRLWDWSTLKERSALAPASPKEIASMHVSPDGLLLATVTGQAGDVCRIWKLPAGDDDQPKELQTLVPPGGDKTLCFRDCKFSPDGSNLYTIQTKSRSDSYLTKWSTKSWKVISTTVAHTRMAGACVALNVSQDGKFVATGSGEGELAIFRSNDMKWIHRKRVHDFFVSKVAFAPDSAHIFSTSGDYTLAVTAVQPTRGFVSMYGKELFVTLAILVALLAVLAQVFM